MPKKAEGARRFILINEDNELDMEGENFLFTKGGAVERLEELGANGTDVDNCLIYEVTHVPFSSEETVKVTIDSC